MTNSGSHKWCYRRGKRSRIRWGSAFLARSGTNARTACFTKWGILKRWSCHRRHLGSSYYS